jgi:hypothetical protein
MNVIHATDSEIQEYSLSNIYDSTVAEHIKNCRQCSEKATQYNMISVAIGQQTVPAFDFNVAQSVMEQLAKKQAIDKYFIYCGTGAAACMLAVLFYVIKGYLPNVLAGLTPLLIALIVITALGVLFFVAMDMYRKFKAKIDALNFS